eukprot:scaffold10733_cov14-Prasinocladus_malaysianus.AAC.1
MSHANGPKATIARGQITQSAKAKAVSRRHTYHGGMVRNSSPSPMIACRRAPCVASNDVTRWHTAKQQ